MPVPPRGDPRRPLHLAASSCRVLGVLALILGTCAGVPILIRGTRGGPAILPALLSLAFFFVGGAGYLVLAHFIKRRRLWAIIAALVLTSIACLLFLMMAAGMLVVMLRYAPGFQGQRVAWTALAVYVLIAVALGQLVYHLARSIGALKVIGPDEFRGFDVLPVAVLPTDPAGTP